MKIAIIGAMVEEIQELYSILESKYSITKKYYQITYGIFNNIKLAILQSGIGKVSAAINTTILIQKFKPNYIINIGTAGGLFSGLNIGDVVISTKTCYHDVDLTLFGYKLGQMANCPILFHADNKLIKLAILCVNKLNYSFVSGIICTGDSFIQNKNNIKNMEFTPIAIDMEGASISHVCYHFNIPFIVIRVISDIINTNSYLFFKKRMPLFSFKLCNIIKILLSLVK